MMQLLQRGDTVTAQNFGYDFVLLIFYIVNIFVKMEEEKCYCSCHVYSGVYRNNPCSVCGHNDSDGEFVGGIIYGYWKLKETNERDVKEETR